VPVGSSWLTRFVLDRPSRHRIVKFEESGSGVYAIVRSGGRQHKVAVGDVVEVDRTKAEVGSSIELTPLLVVDGESVTSEAQQLAKIKVSAEVLGEVKGVKIHILKYKNKTGYKKRQGHRQKYTRVKVTGIEG
jgi:large subunit ribosomal protein L21